MNHPITPLASAQINHDQLKIELVEPDTMPAMVRIVWPAAPTIVDRNVSPILPRRSRNCSLGQHIVLAALKAGKQR
jgi:hypothetical protein